MKVVVLGLWHLGSVTAACLADAGVDTTGIDFDAATVEALSRGAAPLFEPGLDDLLRSGLAAKRLRFSSDIAQAADADVVWVAYDTPVDEEDRSDVAFVTDAVARVFPYLKNDVVVLISSQVPVGTTRQLARRFGTARPGVQAYFAYSAENLRLGHAIRAFKEAERIVVGVDGSGARDLLGPLLAPFTRQVLWVSIESAEMTKHAVNAFLATCVTFANEIATLCEAVGADAFEVETALRLEPRIGARAYIRPGAAFAGGTLARDIVTLNAIATETGRAVPLLAHVNTSNEAHKDWPIRRLVDELGALTGCKIALLGLVYKPGTSTLRRSWAVDLARALAAAGAHVHGYDPAVSDLPADLTSILRIEQDATTALTDADAVVVATEWPQFRELGPDVFVGAMRRPLVLDPNRFLARTLGDAEAIRYVSVGRS